MRIEDLQYLIQVADFGSNNLAAEACDNTQLASAVFLFWALAPLNLYCPGIRLDIQELSHVHE